jgi:hypothetical protein
MTAVAITNAEDGDGGAGEDPDHRVENDLPRGLQPGKAVGGADRAVVVGPGAGSGPRGQERN